MKINGGKKLTAKLAQLAAIPRVPPLNIIGLTIEEESLLEWLDDFRGLITVLMALFKRFGVLLKLNARFTAIRVFDANLFNVVKNQFL